MRVLLVEDEKHLAEMIRRGLTAEGFVVDVAGDGITGQWMATEHPYDVIILDIMLPGRNGYDILRNLRELKIWSPVMILTAKDGDYDQTDAFDLGADDYLTKPFSFIVLVARLRALVRRGAPERPVVLRVGDLELDHDEHRREAREDLEEMQEHWDRNVVGRVRDQRVGGRRQLGDLERIGVDQLEVRGLVGSGCSLPILLNRRRQACGQDIVDLNGGDMVSGFQQTQRQRSQAGTDLDDAAVIGKLRGRNDRAHGIGVDDEVLPLLLSRAQTDVGGDFANVACGQ